MEELQGSVAAEFTSIVERACEICRTCTILKYMHHKNPKKAGHHLCPQCYLYYTNKAGSVCQGGQEDLPQFETENQQAIHQQIAKAQRGCMHFKLTFTTFCTYTS